MGKHFTFYFIFLTNITILTILENVIYLNKLLTDFHIIDCCRNENVLFSEVEWVWMCIANRFFSITLDISANKVVFNEEKGRNHNFSLK